MKYGIEPFCDSWASSYAYKNEDFDQVINLWDVKIMCIRQFQLKVQMYFNNQKSKIQNPVDPAGPDCYRIDTKPCESL